MPVVLSHPGVYVEEIPSGQFTITGVATSITAFVGRAVCGPTDQPVALFSFGDYERIYGGLAHGFPLSYAVQDFFMNGGGQAAVARLFEQVVGDTPSDWNANAAGALTAIQKALTPSPAQPTLELSALFQLGDAAAAAAPQLQQAPAAALMHTIRTTSANLTTPADFAAAVAALTVPPYPGSIATIELSANGGGDLAAPVGAIANAVLEAVQAVATAAFSVPSDQCLSLVAVNAGSWGNRLRAKIDLDNITPQSAGTFANVGLAQSDLFNLTVFYEGSDGTTDSERFTNLTVSTAGDKPLTNRVDLVLANQSQYVRVAAMPATCPAITSGRGSGGNDGQNLRPLTYVGDQNKETGIYMLNKIDLFNLLCIPPDLRGASSDTDPSVYQEALAYCVERRAMLIVDPPAAWSDRYKLGELDNIKPEDLKLYGQQTRNAAVYFPRVIKEDLLMDGQLDTFPACGAIAGVIAATDMQCGVWKAPAGQHAGLTNISTLAHSLTDDEQGELNPLGINCLRNLPLVGPVIWGARTLRGADQLSDDFKYLSVRRLALFLEESLYRGTRWAVFEPNDEALWSSLRLSINAFMGDLAKQGAFYGFQIKCDKDTNSQTNIDKGIVTVLVQYAPVKPAEFVVLQLQQQAGLSPS